MNVSTIGERKFIECELVIIVGLPLYMGSISKIKKRDKFMPLSCGHQIRNGLMRFFHTVTWR